MHMIREGVKGDCAVKPQVGATSITGEWFRMDTFAKAKFTAIVRGQNAGDDCTFAVYQALNAAGGTELQLGATITMAQGIKVTMASVTMNTVSVADTLILTPYYFNGEGIPTAGTALTYTAAAATSVPNRQFINTDNDAAAAALAECINDATYGVPGMLATAASAVVTLTCTEPGGGDRQVTCENDGTGAFDITESNARLVVQDLIQMADFEVYVQDLTRNSDYTHVGARFASIETDVYTVAFLERAMAGYGPVGQAVAYTDTSA